MNGDQRCEVGIKYPYFNKKILIKRYILSLTGVYEPKWSKESKSYKTFYELWQNEDKTVSFSFEKGHMGEGGYCGATFDNFERAIYFVEWFLQNSNNEAKDIDLFINRLGGLSLNEVDAINKNELITA